MDLRLLLDEWTALGITLWEDAGQLRYRAPRGTVTPQTLTQLRTHKEGILGLLREDSAPQAHPDDRFEPFPLTDVQGAYLMGRSSVFEYSGVACHLYCEVNYPRLDPGRALEAWRRLVDRHDMLRAEIDASGFQRVRPSVNPLEIPVTTLADDAPRTRAAQLARVRERLSHCVHPTGSWPMFAIEFTQPPPGDLETPTTMHISFDFLVGDWASLLMLIREWEREYEGREKTSETILQFRDYVLWERAQRESQSFQRAREYWLQRIEALPSAPRLPVCGEVPSSSTTVQWSGRGFLLPRARWQALEQHAREHGLTASAAVLTCYADVLSRWAESPHFCLNLTVLDRPSGVPELARVVGDFTSVTLLETTVDTRPFRMRAHELLQQLFNDLDHRIFSGVEVMRELARVRGREAAIMPYVFTSAIGLGNDDDGESSVRGRMQYSISQTPQAFLDCQVMDDADGLHVHWDAREGMFPEGMLDDMFTAFTNGLEALARESASWEAPSPSDLPQWQRLEREEANATDRHLPSGTLHEFVIEAARATPTAPAVIGRDIHVTYEQLLARAAQIADALRAAGVRHGHRVAIAVPRSPDQIAAVLGTLIAGAAYVPLDVRHPRARMASICDDAQVAALVYSAGYRVTETVPDINLDLLSPEELVDPPAAAVAETSPDDLAYVIYTSGSTGRPKGVEISHQAVVNTIQDVNARFSLSDHDRTLAVAELSFDLSVYDIFGPLSVGGAVVLPPPDTIVTPSTWLNIAAEYDVTTMNTVPAVARLLLTSLSSTATPPSTIQQWILSGDRIAPELVRDLQAAFPLTQFVAMGGATEAAIWSIAHPITPDEQLTDSIPYGRPLANQQFAVLDALGRDTPTGVPGELIIMGAGLANGYTNAPELTQRKFVDDAIRGRMYRTGDRGFYLPGGEIEILGRIDDQVKIRGHRIELGEVENSLTEHSAVKQAAVVVTGTQDQRRLHGFVVPNAVVDGSLEQWARDSAAEASARVDISDGDGIAAYALALERACISTLTRTLDEIDAGLAVSRPNEWIVEVWREALSGEPRQRISGSNVERLWQRVASLSPRGFDYRHFTGYIRRCVDRLPALLAGEAPAHELLFPQGSQSIAERVYQDRASMRWGNAAVTALVSHIASQASTPLRILEVGAGTGSTTHQIEAGLLGVDFHYTFTDRSPYFLPTARQRWGGDQRWLFDTLDIDDDPAGQGFPPRSYDLVCAFGVLENARSIPDAIARLTALAADGGVVLLSEPVGEQWWVYLSQIFLMTKPHGNRRATGLFPSAQWWASQVSACTGGGVVTLPDDDSALSPERFAFFATRMDVSRALAPTPHEALSGFLNKQLPDVMVPQRIDIVPALPLTRNGKIDRQALVSNGQGDAETTPAVPSSPPNRAETTTTALPAGIKTIAVRMARLWADQLSLQETPDIEANPFDLGASSITAASVAGRLREETTELSELSFETILRALLTTANIASAAENLCAHDVHPRTSDEQPVKITQLRAWNKDRPKPPRLTVLFSASLTASMSTTQLADALPPEAGAIVTVVVPDDWFTGQPADMVTGAIANATAMSIAKTADEYCLIGYSYGALAAIETGRRLLEDGHRLVPLGLIDPHVVPVTADERLSEVMFLTARGADLNRLAADEDAPSLTEILTWVAHTQSPDWGRKRGSDGQEPDRIQRFLASMGALDQRTRWELYRDSMPASQRMSPERLRQEWARYRHTMLAATVAPEPLVADAAIIQPRSSYGFLPGAHEYAAQAWRDILIGTTRVVQVHGDHFNMLGDKYLAGTAEALIDTLTTLGAFTQERES